MKPLKGKGPDTQINLYKIRGKLTPGTLIGKDEIIDDIPITDEIYMRITFPKPGAALYSFYKYVEEDGKVVEE